MTQQRQQLRSERDQIRIRGDRRPATYDKPRVFVRGIESMAYNLNEQRQQLLADVPRVFSPSFKYDTTDSNRVFGEGDHNLLLPDDEPFRSQSLHINLSAGEPGTRNQGHGHQNEAMFYILEGHGWEEHDGQEYPWEAGDVVVVHNDSVHWHCNPTNDWTLAIVMKAKPMWLFLGMHQQGEIGYVPPDVEQRGPRVEWNVARRPEDLEGRKKILRPGDTPWEWTPHSYTRKIAGTGVPIRLKATTAHLHEIPVGSNTGKRWQMADECVYFTEGSGYSLHWDVAVEIDDQFYARVALEPTRWEWKAGDFMWVPQNMVFQHFNSDPAKPAKFLSGSNTAFEWLGYQSVDLEPCPEWQAQHPG